MADPTKGTPNGGSTKYARAVADARGQTQAKEGDSTSLVTQGGEANLPAPMMSADVASLIVKKADDKTKAEFLNAPGFAWAPTAYSMRPGDIIQGILEGKGHPASINGTGSDGKPETRLVDTWVVRHPSNGRRISILSSVQLAKKLKPFIGQLVGIFRDDDLQIANARRVGMYEVRGPDMPGLETAWTTETSEPLDANVIDLEPNSQPSQASVPAKAPEPPPEAPAASNMEDRA